MEPVTMDLPRNSLCMQLIKLCEADIHMFSVYLVTLMLMKYLCIHNYLCDNLLLLIFVRRCESFNSAAVGI